MSDLLMLSFLERLYKIHALLVFELPEFGEKVCNSDELKSSLSRAKMLI